MKIGAFSFAALLCSAAVASANDSWGGWTPSGLHYGPTEAIAMEEERLRISPKRIEVDYVYRNLTDAPVTGEVIFPLQPIGLLDLYHSPFSVGVIDDFEKAVDFGVVVDGTPVKASIDFQALLTSYEETEALAKDVLAYTPPGEDVTAYLRSHGIPITTEYEAVAAVLAALPKATQAELQAKGLIDFMSGDEDAAAPLWSVAPRFHWTQTFAPSAATRISHTYNTLAEGGVFSWDAQDTYGSNAPYVAKYCIDDQLSAQLAERSPTNETAFFSQEISYILRTANSWAGPIKDFKLTIDTGKEGNLLASCFEGLVKTGPTTYELVRSDYAPPQDLNIMLVLDNVPFDEGDVGQ